MDVDPTIRYSDVRLCEVAACRPNDPEPLHRIITRRANMGDGLTEAMRGTRGRVGGAVSTRDANSCKRFRAKWAEDGAIVDETVKG